MPQAIFSGMEAKKINMTEGLILLLKPKNTANTATQTTTDAAKVTADPYKMHELIYIDFDGKPILSNPKTILEEFAKHYKTARFVPSALDAGEVEIRIKYYNALQNWLKAQVVTETQQADGTVKQTAGAAQLNFLNDLKQGKTVENAPTAEAAKFRLKNFSARYETVFGRAITGKPSR